MYNAQSTHNVPYNKGKLIGQKTPLKLKEIWSIRIRLQLTNRTRELALFNLAIDSKLRGCDLVELRVKDITHANQVASRAIVMRHNTHKPVQFEITEQTRDIVSNLDYPSSTENRTIPISKLSPYITAHFDETVCTE